MNQKLENKDQKIGFLMKNFSLRKKLIILCFSISVISFLISIVAFRGFQKVEDRYSQITEGSMENVEHLNEMFLSYRAVRINLRSLGLPGISEVQNQEFVTKAIAAIGSYEDSQKEYERIHFIDGQKELFDKVLGRWNDFKKIGERALALNKQNTAEAKAELLKIFLNDCPKAASEYTEAVNALLKFHKAEVHNDKQMAHQIVSETHWIVGAIAVVAFIVSLIAGSLVATLIGNSISQIVLDLKRNSDSVSSTSVHVADLSDSLSKATTEQSAALQETTSALEEISSMIEKATENAGDASSSAGESHQKALEGRVAVEQMISSMSEISESNQAIQSHIEDSHRQMNEIIKVIEEIGEKTKVINEIVFQTKLLSFNASVEAARAGEAGKGFAVVAEEVGNLAQMSGKSATEITSLLHESISKVNHIASGTKDKINILFSESSQKVQQGVLVSQKCGSILNEIVEIVERVSSLSSGISQANTEQSQGVQSIKLAMDQLNQVTQMNASDSEKTSDAADELKSQVCSLSNAIEQLRVLVEGGAISHENEMSRNVKLAGSLKVKSKFDEKRAPKDLDHQKWAS